MKTTLKKLIPLFLAVGSIGIAKAQDGSYNGFAKNKILISGGVGTGNLINTLSKQLIVGTKLNYTKTPLLFFKGEYAIDDHWGVGLSYAQTGFNLSYRRPTDSFIEAATNNKIPVEVGVEYKSFSVLGRANYHFIPNSQFDVYLGIGIGYRNNKFTVGDNDPLKNWDINLPAIPSLGLDATVGMRAYIIPNLAAYGEFGVAKGILQGGLTLSF